MRAARIICGSRIYPDEQRVRDHVFGLAPRTVLILGQARGPDRWAQQAAEEMGLEQILCPAQWETYGRRAGIIRNQLMLEILEGLPVAEKMCVGFPYGEARGTTHMVELAQSRGINWQLITTDMEVKR